MLCGNKTDMRSEAEQQGRKTVSYEDGQRLARVSFESVTLHRIILVSRVRC